MNAPFLEFRHPELVQGSVLSVAAVYDRRPLFQPVAAARRAAVIKAASCSRGMTPREPGQQVARATQGERP